jgi:2-hydroxy-3-keto-5-methylthiopentenyl-1-phosphate phosphatase
MNKHATGMGQPIIAIICDFDGTLGPDMVTFLLEKHRIDPDEFWNHKIDGLVKDGWDPAQAYMQELLKLIKRNKIPNLTKERLQELGSKLSLFDGVTQLFPALKNFIKTDRDLKNIPLELEYYVVSGGLEQMIRGSKIAGHMTEIFGCEFAYNEATGIASAVKRTISFTEKTKFIYAINKGVAKEICVDPYRVNAAMDMAHRPIPFSQMIYIGDGPSDIPCMSMIRQNGGQGMGVGQKHKFTKAYELAQGKRSTVGPYLPDYRKNSVTRLTLQEILKERGMKIGIQLRERYVEAPTH